MRRSFSLYLGSNIIGIRVFVSGGRVSKFRRSVIRQRPARQSVILPGRSSPSVVSPSLRRRSFNRASVIAKLQFGRVSKFRRAVFVIRQ